MLGNTLLLRGTDEQKAHYLPRILSGADTWCQGYSEPNAGSDLGNLGLRAVLDGDQWVLNGQKIWTSAGHLADHIFTLARTDPDAPKHKGISFLLVDMRQPGIEVRPIKMISGESEFNEIFYTDAVVPKDDVVGGVNNGWAVAMTLLGFERGEAAATMPIRFQAELERLVRLAKERGVDRRSDHPPAPGVVPLEGPDHALQRDADADQVPRRPPSRAPTGRSPSCTGASTTGSSPSWPSTSSAPTPSSRPGGRRRRRSRPTTPGPRTARPHGSTRSSTPGPARSTPARRRSSATSSARWCSACPRSRGPRDPRRPRRRPAAVVVVDSRAPAQADGRAAVVGTPAVPPAAAQRVPPVPTADPIRRIRASVPNRPMW